MKLKQLFIKRYFKFISNKYLFITLFFAIWMLFLDTNSWLIHRTLNNELKVLEENKQYYQTEITKDEKLIQILKDSTGLEKYAREKYFMKKENEDIYIIEYEKNSIDENE